MKKFYVALFFTSFLACKNGKEDQQKLTDSTDNYVISETDSLLNTESAIAEFRIATDNAISKENLIPVEEWREENAIQSSFIPSPKFLNDYKPVLRYSPDSSKILDFGSYGSVVITNEKGESALEGGDPDTEVSVIDLKKKIRKRLFFSGPSGVIKSGSWLNNTTVMFSGYFHELNNTKPDTLFWIVNVDSLQFKKFKYNK